MSGLMLIALYVVAVLAITGAFYVHVAHEDEKLEGWTDLKETKVPRSFGRLDKQDALDRTNAHYRSTRCSTKETPRRIGKDARGTAGGSEGATVDLRRIPALLESCQMPQTKQHHAFDLATLAWDIASVPYSVARADALDRIDVGARQDVSVVRGVNVLELVTFTNPLATIGEVAHLASELGKIGARPCVKFHRNDAGMIDGFTVCRELVA